MTATTSFASSGCRPRRTSSRPDFTARLACASPSAANDTKSTPPSGGPSASASGSAAGGSDGKGAGSVASEGSDCRSSTPGAGSVGSVGSETACNSIGASRSGGTGLAGGSAGGNVESASADCLRFGRRRSQILGWGRRGKARVQRKDLPHSGKFRGARLARRR